MFPTTNQLLMLNGMTQQRKAKMIISYDMYYSSTHGHSILAIDESGAVFPIKHIDNAEEAEKFLQEKLNELPAKGQGPSFLEA